MEEGEEREGITAVHSTPARDKSYCAYKNNKAIVHTPYVAIKNHLIYKDLFGCLHVGSNTSALLSGPEPDDAGPADRLKLGGFNSPCRRYKPSSCALALSCFTYKLRLYSLPRPHPRRFSTDNAKHEHQLENYEAHIQWLIPNDLTDQVDL